VALTIAAVESRADRPFRNRSFDEAPRARRVLERSFPVRRPCVVASLVEQRLQQGVTSRAVVIEVGNVVRSLAGHFPFRSLAGSPTLAIALTEG